MNLSLAGKKAIVCGSTQGIGQAIAVGLAGIGAEVTLLARNEEKLKATVGDLPQPEGQQHDYLAADFTSPETLREKVSAFIGDQVFHILVNNTGGPPGGPASEADPAAYKAAFDQHLICNQILTQSVVPGMKQAGYGRIINIISTSVKQPIAGLGVSNTIRGAVASWSKTIANELGPHKITVNNVLPGATKTQRLTTILENRAAKSGKSVAEVTQAWMDEIPARRFAEPEEVAHAAVFLASPAASYINGINIPVDGGRTSCL